MVGDSRRAARLTLASLVAGLVACGVLMWIAVQVAPLREAQLEILGEIRQVLEGVIVIQFSEVVVTQGGRSVTVTTTCRSGETEEDCWARHNEAVAVVAASQ